MKGFLGAEQTVALRWQSKKIEIMRKALVTAEATATAHVTPTVIKYSTQLKLEIVQGRLSKFTVALPKSQALTQLVGEQIRDWQVKNEGENQILTVEFIKPIEHSYSLTLFSEQVLETSPTVVALTTPQPLDLERESGSLTVSAEDMTAEIDSAVGLRQVNAPGNSLAAYRFNGHPFALSLRLKRIAPPSADSLRLTGMKNDLVKCKPLLKTPAQPR